MKSFASDNYSTVHPAVLKAFQEANTGHARAYGEDPWTTQAEEKIRSVFGADTFAFFVFNGTGGNVTALRSLARPFDAIICSQQAHIHQDEGGAPECISGLKLLDMPPGAGGKLLPEHLFSFKEWIGDQHKPQPKVISITQSTEKGAIYSLAELRALADAGKKLGGVHAHIDGARYANAIAALGGNPQLAREIVQALNAQALVLGGTKNGLMGGEAVLVFDPAIADRVKFIRKQNMQLASKHRYIAAQFCAYFDFWLSTAAHANAMAKLLADELAQISEVKLTETVQANAVFAILPEKVIAPLQKEFPFYVWDIARQEVRLMASFDTTVEEVKNFVVRLKALLGS